MKIWRELLGYVKVIVIVVAITLVINNVVLINAKIPSPSMENNTYGQRPSLSASAWRTELT